jgi:hypothetical protein
VTGFVVSFFVSTRQPALQKKLALAGFFCFSAGQNPDLIR